MIHICNMLLLMFGYIGNMYVGQILVNIIMYNKSFTIFEHKIIYFFSFSTIKITIYSVTRRRLHSVCVVAAPPPKCT